MIIRPARKRKETIRPALLVDHARARSLDDGRLHDLDHLPKGLRCYVSWDDADAYARAGHGELVAWSDEPIRYRHKRRGDSHRRRADAVIVKQPATSLREFEQGITGWCDWLDRHDVNPGWSLGGASISLLRATLDAPLVTTNGELPEERWTLGGRQQCWLEPGTSIHGAVQLDLPAAYTTIIGGMRYGGVWRRIAKPSAHVLDLNRDAGYPILVVARVRLPLLEVGPLHRRPKRRPDSRIEELAPTVPYPVRGNLAGLWTLDELEQADAAGAAIAVDEAYVHTGGDRRFEPWLEAIIDGRGLDGFTGQLCKATGNALWGQFVIDDRKQLHVQRWNGRYQSLPVQASSGHQRRAWDLGELVCGAVRAKLYTALSACTGGLVCAHTDGLWVRDSYKAELARVCLEQEGWRVKDEAAELQLLDQQKYRYRPRRARSWRVVCSGVPASRAEDVFETLWQRFTA